MREEIHTGDDHRNEGILQAMLAAAPQNAPRTNDDHLPRFAASFLQEISLYTQHGNNFIGDFNPKLPSGANARNFNYWPAFELMPIFGGTTVIPFEVGLTETDEEPKPAPFDEAEFSRSRRPITSVQIKTAKQCANTALLRFAELGLVMLDSLTGFYATEDDKGLMRAAWLYDLVLPIHDKTIFPVGDVFNRIRAGEAFRGPFLDQIQSFLRNESRQRIANANLPTFELEVARALHNEVRAGVDKGMKIAARIINVSHAEMKNPQGLKRKYDESDLETYDAPVARDLYCLAHLNISELDNRQLEASGNIGRELADGIKEALSGILPQAPQTAAPGAMTAEEMKIEFEIERDAMRDEHNKEMAEMREMIMGGAIANPVTPAGEAETIVETVTETVTETTKKAGAKAK